MALADYTSASSYMEMERMMSELDYRNEKRMHEMMRNFQYQMMPMAQPMSNPYQQSAPAKPSPEIKAQKEKKDKLKCLVAYYYHKRK